MHFPSVILASISLIGTTTALQKSRHTLRQDRSLHARAEPLILGMGQSGAAGSDRDCRIVDVNGCTPVYFFGAGWVVGAHVEAGGAEQIECKEAAELAKEKGASDKVIVFPPDIDSEGDCLAGIEEVFPHIPRKVHRYGYEENNEANFKFEVKAGTQTAEWWKNDELMGSITK